MTAFVNKRKLTGVELIAVERLEQQYKHGRTLEQDLHRNNDRELATAASELIQVAPLYADFPMGWDKAVVQKMADKPYKERLIIAGALLAAEIDRLNATEEA